MEFSKTTRNAFDALFYLIWTIVKEQWKTLLALIIFIGIIIPLPKIIASEGGYQSTTIGIMGLFYTLPILLITLVYLPMVHNQIYSSSIKKRLNASGVSSKLYAITMILTFTIVALSAYYLLSIIAFLIWNNSTFIYDTGSETFELPVWFMQKTNWLSMIILAPISIFGLSATGLFIGRLKIAEIVKGVAVFFFIALLILMSRTIFNPLFADMTANNEWSYDGDELLNSEVKKQAMLMSNIFILNPWGSMLFTLQDSLNSEFHKVVNVGFNEWTNDGIYQITWDKTVNSGRLFALIWASISSIVLTTFSIFTMK